MKRLLPVFLALAAVACGSGIEPEPEFALSFNVVPVDTLMTGDTVVFQREQIDFNDLDKLVTLRPVQASAAPGTIRVVGSFVTGCSGTQPDASMERRPGGVTLVIAFPPKRMNACATVPEPYTYEARFTEVSSGSYNLVVEHKGDIIRTDGVVLEQQVQVP